MTGHAVLVRTNEGCESDDAEYSGDDQEPAREKRLFQKRTVGSGRGQPDSGYLAQHSSWITGETGRQLGPSALIEVPARLQEIGAVEDPAYHVPLRQPHAVVTHRVEHAAIGFAVGLGPSRAGGAMPYGRWTR